MQQLAHERLTQAYLRDRHDNNVMANKLTGRPIQIDPSGVVLVESIVTLKLLTKLQEDSSSWIK